MAGWPDYFAYDKRVSYGCLVRGADLASLKTLEINECRLACDNNLLCEGFYYIANSNICFIVANSKCHFIESDGTAVYCRKTASSKCDFESYEQLPVWAIPAIICGAVLLVVLCSCISFCSRYRADRVRERRRARRAAHRRKRKIGGSASKTARVRVSEDGSLIIAYHDLEKSTTQMREQNMASGIRRALADKSCLPEERYDKREAVNESHRKGRVEDAVDGTWRKMRHEEAIDGPDGKKRQEGIVDKQKNERVEERQSSYPGYTETRRLSEMTNISSLRSSEVSLFDITWPATGPKQSPTERVSDEMSTWSSQNSVATIDSVTTSASGANLEPWKLHN